MRSLIISIIVTIILSSCVENSKRKIYLHASSDMFMGHKYLTLYANSKFEICEMVNPHSGIYEINQDTLLLTYPDILVEIVSGDTSYKVPINEWLPTALIIDSTKGVITSLNGQSKFIVSFNVEKRN